MLCSCFLLLLKDLSNLLKKSNVVSQFRSAKLVNIQKVLIFFFAYFLDYICMNYLLINLNNILKSLV